jgi:2,3-bisphosphoglycerate-dependent phosphoglycerate mutase
MRSLVLLRHGESTWNREGRFTGWTDVGLTDRGLDQAAAAAAALLEHGYRFDVAFTSVLKRAIKTLWVVLEEMDLMWIPVHRSWRLNERHYGALQGLGKREAAKRYGATQLEQWRRGYAVRPPALLPEDERSAARDPRYAELPPHAIPLTESLADTLDRLLPYWSEAIAPELARAKRVLVSAHGNSLRALVKHLDRISEAEIVALNIPVAIPLVYELDEHLDPIRRFFLADPDELAAATRAVEEEAR